MYTFSDFRKWFLIQPFEYNSTDNIYHRTHSAFFHKIFNSPGKGNVWISDRQTIFAVWFKYLLFCFPITLCAYAYNNFIILRHILNNMKAKSSSQMGLFWRFLPVHAKLQHRQTLLTFRKKISKLWYVRLAKIARSAKMSRLAEMAKLPRMAKLARMAKNFKIAKVADTEIDCRGCREKRFHLFKSLVYKNGKAQNMPVVAGRIAVYKVLNFRLPPAFPTFVPNDVLKLLKPKTIELSFSSCNFRCRFITKDLLETNTSCRIQSTCYCYGQSLRAAFLY